MAGMNLMGRLADGIEGDNPGGNQGDATEKKDVEIEIPTSDGEKTTDNAFEDKDDPGSYMNVYQNLKNDIQKVEDNTVKIDNITAQLIKATSNAEEKEVTARLNQLMADNTKIAQSIKDQLKEQKLANDKFAVDRPGSSVAQWRINQLNTCTRKFQQSSNKFQAALNRFNSELKNRQQRHIGLIDKKLTTEEIENLVSDPARAQIYIQQSFQLVDVGDAMMDRLVEIETRTAGMQKIYESLEELRTMWQELNFLISEQQEYLDSIENNVQQTKDYVAQATVHLQKAEKHQKTSRKLQFCLLCVCFIVLLVILIVLGSTGVFSKS